MNAVFHMYVAQKSKWRRNGTIFPVKGKRNLSTRKRLHSQTGGGPPEKVEDEAETDAVEDILGKDNVCIGGVEILDGTQDAANHMLNTFTSLVSRAPTLDGIRLPQLRSTQPEGLAFNLPPRPPHDPYWEHCFIAAVTSHDQ
ncbi:hypothetical protein GWK47_021160 [Chionoecetes opilio]|uniref:Uncharacterized protein n=1 Tax=Chionoecetes opilio TaxID=41210 RepID=A0A8J4XPC5_CHIOP|nr:hypothetical protein GWK47_021160 [Chionoecetes opilio]